MSNRRVVKAFFVVIFTCVLCEDTFDQDLYKLANSIAWKYFNSYSCVTHITDKFESEGRLVVKNHYMTFNVKVSKIPKCPKWDEDCSAELVNLLWESYFQGCAGYVIQVESSQRSRLVKTLLKAYSKSPANRYNNKRYLFLPVDEFDNDMDIVDSPDMFFMPNMLLVTCNVSSSVPKYNFSIYTHNTFHGHKYDVLGVKHEVVTTWSSVDGFSNNEDLYPDKIENLHGKKLILSVIHYIPYTIVIKEENGTSYDGLETRIAAEFTEMVNASWEGKVFPGLWGELLENGTANGILGATLDHHADMGMAAIYQWYCDVLDCSYPYIFVDVICLVPRPQLLPGFLTIVISFTPETWGYFITAYITSSLFVFFVYSVLEHMKDGKTIRSHKSIIFESFFITFRLQLEQIPKLAYKKTPLAIYTRWLTIYYFFVAVVWSGGIASVLTVPRYEEPINKAVDLTSRWPRMEWGGNHIDWVLSIEQSSEPILKQIVDKFVVLDEDTLRRRTKTGDFGFFMERLPNGHYGFSDYIDKEAMVYLKQMEKSIYTANCVMILPKGSPYLERLNSMLIRMFETGILQKLEYQVSMEKADNQLQNLIRRSTEKPSDIATPLLLHHVQGPLICYVLGAGVSIIVFMVELCVHKWISSKQKKHRKAWH